MFERFRFAAMVRRVAEADNFVGWPAAGRCLPDGRGAASTVEGASVVAVGLEGALPCPAVTRGRRCRSPDSRGHVMLLGEPHDHAVERSESGLRDAGGHSVATARLAVARHPAPGRGEQSWSSGGMPLGRRSRRSAAAGPALAVRGWRARSAFEPQRSTPTSTVSRPLARGSSPMVPSNRRQLGGHLLGLDPQRGRRAQPARPGCLRPLDAIAPSDRTFAELGHGHDGRGLLSGG
jgi:hypothetical protein